MTELVALSTKSIQLNRNEFLKMEGSVDTNLYFIERGTLKLFVMDNSEEQIIRFGYTHNLVAALDSFLTHQPSKLLIQAIKKTDVRVIRKAQLDGFIQIEANRALWAKLLEDLVVQQIEREIDILTSSPKARYLRVLQRSPQLFQEIPLRYIANYLRMSAETLSRLRKS
ncbi:MAG: cyclic nucleotide-binding domain-containing protein [Chitinophagales bacterium]